MTERHSVAIIGAGLSGLALAIALHEQNIKSVVYESRPAPLNIGGAIMLSPNGLRVLDRLGLYGAVRDKGFNFESSEFRHPDGRVIDTLAFGDERKHGYKGNRVYRYELIDIMLDAVKNAGEDNIKVVYGQKFASVIDEGESDRGGVTFKFTNGVTATASLLIGADGIHSTVRKYLYPDNNDKGTDMAGSNYAPRFIGYAGISASVPSSSLPANVSIDLPVTIISPPHGAFVVAPQKRDGSELFIGKQTRIEGDPSRVEWDAIHADRESSRKFLQRDNAVYGSIATAVTANISLDRINVWPFFVLPTLPHWASPRAPHRVVLVGDAAHAIPPSAGQGISQAMEDVWMLALLVGRITAATATAATASQQQEKTSTSSLSDALEFWQRFRQDRISRILELNAKIDQRRLPKLKEMKKEGQGQGQGQIPKKEEGEEEKEQWDMSWLFDIDIDTVVDEWMVEMQKKKQQQKK